MKKNKIMIIIIIVLIVLTILLMVLSNNKISNNISDYYVSNLRANDINNIDVSACNIDEVLKNNKIPYFNLNSQVYNDINKEILTDFFLRTCYQNGEMTYEKNISDDILSLILTISYEDADDTSYLEYKTYNINLDNNTLITNENLLNKYNITLSNINNILKSTFTKYYLYEKKNGNYDSKFNFNDFLDEIGYQNLSYNDLNLYLENNTLYLYVTYNTTELMALDNNYPEIITKFKLN